MGVMWLALKTKKVLLVASKIENKPASTYSKQGLQPNTNGYPNNIASTQTQKTRGTGAQTKGTKHSTKMG